MGFIAWFRDEISFGTGDDMSLTTRLRRWLSEFAQTTALRRKASVLRRSHPRYLAEPLENRLLLIVTAQLDPADDTGTSSSDGITRKTQVGYIVSITGTSAVVPVYRDVLDDAHKINTLFFNSNAPKTISFFAAVPLSTGPHTIIFDGTEHFGLISFGVHTEIKIGVYPTLQQHFAPNTTISPPANQDFWHNTDVSI